MGDQGKKTQSGSAQPGSEAGQGGAQAASGAGAGESYEPPQLLKFEKLEKLIVSGE
jgi:hypothetical protein